jgi:hypothetical protein
MKADEFIEIEIGDQVRKPALVRRLVSISASNP